jgi:hypothetical protein
MGADDIGIRKDCLQNVSSLHNTLTGSFGDAPALATLLAMSSDNVSSFDRRRPSRLRYCAFSRRNRNKPSCATEATKTPSLVNTEPREKPRELLMLGLSCT